MRDAACAELGLDGAAALASLDELRIARRRLPMRTLMLLVAAFALAACNTPAPQASAPPAPGSAVVTPSNFQLPEGGSCSAEIARYRAIQDNDLSMGHVAKSVYNQIKREIGAAEAACAAGHDAEARGMVVASKTRHGYPTNL
jgi:hypothetical protein